jgi:hypothetical protein
MPKLSRDESIDAFEALQVELASVRAAKNHVGATFVESSDRIQAVADRGSLLVAHLPMAVNFAGMWSYADRGMLPEDGGAPIHSFYRRLHHYTDAAKRILGILRDDVLWGLHGAAVGDPATPSLATQSTVSHFVVRERLGAGVYGEVWRADGTELGRAVAVKFVRTTGADRSTVLEHARALARVAHPNIVAVHGVAAIADPIGRAATDAVVMELVEGPTLVEKLGRQISREEAVRICHGLCAAIGAYHEQGLAHLDLHEGNVIVGFPTVKVLDPLYFDTAVLTSTSTRDAQRRRDIRALRDIVVQVLTAAAVPMPEVQNFDRESAKATVQELSTLAGIALEGAARGDESGGHAAPSLRASPSPFVVFETASNELFALRSKAYSLIGDVEPSERLVLFAPLGGLSLQRRALEDLARRCGTKLNGHWVFPQPSPSTDASRRTEFGVLWSDDNTKNRFALCNDGSFAMRFRLRNDRKGIGQKTANGDVGLYTALELFLGGVAFARKLDAICRQSAVPEVAARWCFRLVHHEIGGRRLMYEPAGGPPMDGWTSAPCGESSPTIAGDFSASINKEALGAGLDELAVSLAYYFGRRTQDAVSILQPGTVLCSEPLRL